MVVHPHCVDHDPEAEIWLGVSTPATEVAERVTVIESTLRELGHEVVPAREFDDAWLSRVHSAELVDHLATVWDRWVDGGYPDLGAQRVVPYLFPSAELLHGLPARLPAALHAQVGAFCYDTMTLVGPGSWQAIRAATHVTRTAADLVVSGAPCAYALTRPPGHHATRSAYGGSCYLNNAAIAAQALRDADFARVAVVDIDAHHGNGTQAIFYERPDVFTTSVHVDPGAGWFPHHVGFADETGRDAGHGANLNQPLAPGSGDQAWLSAVERAADAATAFERNRTRHRPRGGCGGRRSGESAAGDCGGLPAGGQCACGTGPSDRGGAGGRLPSADAGPVGRFGARRARVWLA